MDLEKDSLSVRAAMMCDLPAEFPAARRTVVRVTGITDGCVVPETFRAKPCERDDTGDHQKGHMHELRSGWGISLGNALRPNCNRLPFFEERH